MLGDSVYDEKCSTSSRRTSGSIIRKTGSCSTISENIKKELADMEPVNKKSLAAKTTFIKFI